MAEKCSECGRDVPEGQLVCESCFDKKMRMVDMAEKCSECGRRAFIVMREGQTVCEDCFAKKMKPVEMAKYTPALQRETNNQDADEEYLIDSIAVELKKDINYLISLGIKLDKGALATKTGGAAWAGYEAFTGHWLSALVIGGISLVAGGLTNSYKRIKLMEMKQKWMNRFSGLSQEQLAYLTAGLQRKYPLLLGQFQNLLQAGQR